MFCTNMKSSLVYFVIAIIFFVNSVTSLVLPYPGDCTKFQLCDTSGCFIFNCGIGTEFNPATQTCDYPLRDRVNCRSVNMVSTRNQGFNIPYTATLESTNYNAESTSGHIMGHTPYQAKILD